MNSSFTFPAVSKYIRALINQTLNELSLPMTEVVIEKPAERSHGDLASPVAMTLFSQVSDRFQSPHQLAQALVEKLIEAQSDFKGVQFLTTQTKKIDEVSDEADHNLAVSQIFEKVTVAGPGFINFKLSTQCLINIFKEMVLNGVERSITQKDSPWVSKKIIVEFTDPNPFKELHIGHLYSNIVGESISRLLESQGAVLLRVCYQGDIGIHVAKSLWGMMKLFENKIYDVTRSVDHDSIKNQLLQEEKSILTHADSQSNLDFQDLISEGLKHLEAESLQKRVHFLGLAYAIGATAYKDLELAKNEIQKINGIIYQGLDQNWQNDDQALAEPKSQIKLLYLRGRQWSLDYFESVYQRLGMKFDDYFFESEVGKIGVEVVQNHMTDGTFIKSEGAIIFPGEKYGLHDRVFINSLGFPTYEAKELGLAPEKYRRWPYDYSVIITGNEINEYFKVLLKAMSLTHPDLQEKTFHLSHGMVRLPEGKMSSRTGKVLTAQWLLEEAIRKISQVLENRPEITEEKRVEIAEKVGLGAIKYAFLKQSIGKDIVFNFSESLSLQGNSGPYLLYTYVRCESVIKKAKNSSIAKSYDTLLNNMILSKVGLSGDENDLLRNISTYSETVVQASMEHAPHLVCSALYNLAQSFNKFYASTKILPETGLFSEQGEEVEAIAETHQFRLLLTETVGLVLKHGLDLLGIETVDQM